MRIIVLIICVSYVRSAVALESDHDNVKKCNDGLGECVPVYLCINGTINTDGTGILNERVENDECKPYVEVCCLIENVKPKDTDDKLKCGVRNLEGVDDRFSDEKAYPGEFPWMVSIISEKKINGVLEPYYVCGGSLIAQNVVLTAAHCVHNKDPKRMRVRAGDWDPQSTYDVYPLSDYYVETIVIHDNYTKKVLYNDLALLFLESDIEFNDNVHPICLPPENQSFDKKKCIVTGWENNASEKEGEYESIVKKSEVPVVPFAQCQKNLKKTRLGSRFTLHNSFMCAGGKEGTDACKKDGGSPLICPVPGVKNQYYQAGIVSWGIGCGSKDVPGIYTNVARYRTWIDTEIFSNILFTQTKSSK